MTTPPAKRKRPPTKSPADVAASSGAKAKPGKGFETKRNRARAQLHPTSPIDLVLSKLPAATATKSGQWKACCPAHNDAAPSLSLNVDKAGRVALHCHAGCDTAAVVAALGLTFADLAPSRSGSPMPSSSRAAKSRSKAAPKTDAPPVSDALRVQAMAAAKRFKSFGTTVSALYPYQLASGAVWAWRARYDRKGGGKEIKPFHQDAAGWQLGEPRAPRSGKPLYRLPQILAADGPVFIVEGEKCADAFAALGVAATTSGGATSASKADWTPCAGRRCVVWPDNDEPGDAYASDVADALRAVGATVELVDVAAVPGVEGEGDDAADWLAANPRASAADVLALPLRAASLGAGGVALVRGDAVVLEPVDWLWPGYLARRKLHILAGSPGTGKTTVALSLAASITAGLPLPDGSDAPRGAVVVWSGEDGISDTLAPRLMAAGADLSRILFVGEVGEGTDQRPFDPALDMYSLDAACAALADPVRLLIVDPIASAISGDGHKNNEVRRGLAPLVEMGERLDASILGISHFSKNTTGRNVLERVTGSLAFGAVPRVVLATARASDGRCILVRDKSNLGPSGDGFRYSIEIGEEFYAGRSNTVSRIKWGEAVMGSPAELLEQLEAKRSAIDAADEWLYEVLANGEVDAALVASQAEQAGIKVRTLERSSARLAVVKQRVQTKPGKRGGGKWTWRLPDDAEHPTTRRKKYE